MYVVTGIVLLIITGGILRALKMTVTAFKWAYLLTPLAWIDLILALAAGLFMVVISVFLPFIPIGLEAMKLQKNRMDAKQYI